MRARADRVAGPGGPARAVPVPPLRDAAVAAVVAGLGGVAAGAMSASLGLGVPGVTGAMVAAGAVPLAWRRRAPVTVLVLTLVLAVAVAAAPGAAFSPLMAALVATYTVATSRSWQLAATTAAAVAVALPLLIREVFGAPFPFSVSVVPTDHLVNDLVGALAVFGGATVLGASVGTHRAYTAGLEERAARLERERVERERRAVLEERARIARELHDVAAHHLSGLVLQAGALERTAGHDPARVRQLAGEVREGGATALASMRRLVGLLRAADDEDVRRGSQPSLADLDGLVDAARGDGLDVMLDTGDGVADAGQVPDEVGLAAYRIVQEALSNTRRHAPGARAEVRLDRHDHRLDVEVVDDGGHTPPVREAGDEPGHGLIGMRERVALLGGELDAGPRSAGGWRVRAEFPLGEEGTA